MPVKIIATPSTFRRWPAAKVNSFEAAHSVAVDWFSVARLSAMTDERNFAGWEMALANGRNLGHPGQGAIILPEFCRLIRVTDLEFVGQSEVCQGQRSSVLVLLHQRSRREVTDANVHRHIVV